jgi:hypothetical protein
VTHRIDVARKGETICFEVHGLLDAAALAALQASVGAAAASGRTVRIVLKAGAQVDRECLPLLQALAPDVEAESPYLARWIAETAATVLHDAETAPTDGPAKVGVAAGRSGRTDRSS